jgi:hypothetical protein
MLSDFILLDSAIFSRDDETELEDESWQATGSSNLRKKSGIREINYTTSETENILFRSRVVAI